MTDNKRLEAIKAKAERMGYEFESDNFYFAITFRWHEQYMDSRFEGEIGVDESFAETLLALLDPKAVRFRIGPCCLHPMKQRECELSPFRCGLSIAGSKSQAMRVPGPDCPAIKMPLGDDEEYILIPRKVR